MKLSFTLDELRQKRDADLLSYQQALRAKYNTGRESWLKLIEENIEKVSSKKSNRTDGCHYTQISWGVFEKHAPFSGDIAALLLSEFNAANPGFTMIEIFDEDTGFRYMAVRWRFSTV